MATLFWAEGVWLGRWKKEPIEGRGGSIFFEVQRWKTRERTRRSGHVRDLVILASSGRSGHTLLSEGQEAVDMRVGLARRT